MTAVDLEESLLDLVEDAQARVEGELEAPAQRAGDCEHLRAAPRVVKPRTPGGLRGVPARRHELGAPAALPELRPRRLLRLLGRAARDRHFDETGHPVMRSIEPGEAWRWCYVDEHLG